MTPTRNPFVGLRPFFVEDSLYFFGREEQTSELLSILHNQRFLGIVGSSGSGKSSLVRAGLLPALLGGFLVEDRSQWRVAQVRPGDAPIANLAAGLLKAMGEPPDGRPRAALEESIREGNASAVHEFLDERSRSDSENVFLLVDQFEEIFAFRRMAGAGGQDATDPDLLGTSVFPVQGPSAQSDEASARVRERARRRGEAADFVELLLTLGASRGAHHIYVALTMRTDFLGDCDVFYGLPEALNRGQYLVPRLTRQQLRRAIEGPARLMGARFAPRLLDHLLNELGDRSDRLPVLQHALLRTFDRWRDAQDPEVPIDLEHYRQAGGLENALNEDAESALTGLDEAVTQRVFRRLTDTDLSQRRVRSPARVSELMDATGAGRETVTSIIRRFEEDGRSFVHAAADGRPDDPRVDISHESLIRQWRRLRGWVDAERDARDRYKQLVDRARTWQRGETSLLQEPELRLHKDWRRREAPTAGWARRYSAAEGDYDLAMGYLRKSVAGNKARLVRLGGITAALILVTALAGIALRERGKAVVALGSAVAQKMTADARAVIRGEQAGGVEFSLQQLLAANALDSSAAAGAVLDALMKFPRLVHVVDLDMLSAAAISMDGRHVAIGTADGTVRLFDSTLREIRVLRGAHQRAITVVGFDPQGARLGSTDGDTLRVWSVADGATVATYASPGGAIVDLGMMPDGIRFVSVDSGGLRVGTARDLVESRPLAGVGGYFITGDFARSTPRLVTASADRTLRVWDLRSAAPDVMGTLDAGRAGGADAAGAPIQSVYVSPHDTLVAAVMANGSVQVWNFLRGRLVHTLSSAAGKGRGADSAKVVVAAFGANDSFLTVGREDGALQVLDMANDLFPVSAWLPTHVGSIVRLAMSDDGSRVIVAGGTGLSVVDVSRVPVAGEPLESTAGVVSLAYSPRDSLLAVGLETGTVDLWNVTARHLVRRLPGHTDWIRSVAFSPDMDLLASASDDHEVRVWNPTTGDVLRTLAGHTDYVMGVAFTPDGARLVSGSLDSTVRVWDARTGDLMQTIPLRAPIMAVAVHPDGSLIAAAASDSSVRIIDASRGTVLQGIARAHAGEVTTVAFGAGGNLASGGTDGAIRVWSPTDERKGWTLVATLTGHAGGISHAAFSADGSVIVSGSEDRTVRRWNAATGEPLGEPLTGHHDEVTAVAFLSAEQVLTSGFDQQIRVWPIANPSASRLCAKLARNLTRETWQDFVSRDLRYPGPLCPGLP